MKRPTLTVAAAAAVLATPLFWGCSGDDSPSSTTSGAGGASATGVGGATSSSADATSATTTAVAASTSSGPLPETFTVTGIVTDGQSPVGGAIVMQGGGSPDFVTGPDGAFAIELTTMIPGVTTIVATKQGYRTVGIELTEVPAEPLELALIFVSEPDNEGYVYGPPGVGDALVDNSTKYCGHCHTTIVAQFQTSAHARSARDPWVQALYAGVTEAHADQASCEANGGKWSAGLLPGTASQSTMKCYLGGGVLPDLNAGCGGAAELSCDDPALPAGSKPAAFGFCADCHAASIDGVAGGRSLHEAVGNAFDNGNHCDFCHHIKDVDLTKPPGVGGRITLQRSVDKLTDDPASALVQVMYGPLPDVPNAFMGGSYQPKFATADLCGGCHQQHQPALIAGETIDAARWPTGLPTHTTYEEWSASPFNSPATPCQACHMPADPGGLVSTVDVTNETNASITFGFLRPPEQIRQHIFRGPLQGTPRLIDNAVALFINTTPSANQLTVDVTLQSIAAGHAIPTGEPMRQLVLVVSATACGQSMTPSAGMTIHDLGGASAAGTVGVDATLQGTSMTWATGAARAKPGDVVRIVRPSGVFDDYVGVGFFADPALTPAQKGLEIDEPVGEATVVTVGGGALVLSAPLTAQAGDRVYLGDALVSPIADGDASRAIAGSPGYTFAKTLVSSSGKRGAPHYRAVDMVSDNRIPPLGSATTTHGFAIPAACASADVSVTLVYRAAPVELARERGWNGVDIVVATATKTVALP